MRSSMAHLVTKLRRLLPASASSLLTDTDLCDALDASSTIAQAVPARALRLPWQPAATRYMAEVGDWEATPTVHDYTQELGVVQFNLATGEFTLESPNAADTLYVSGRHVDMNAAAALALDALMAKLSTEFDFATDDQRFQRSQQVEMLAKAAEQFRKQARPKTATLRREDVTGVV